LPDPLAAGTGIAAAASGRARSRGRPGSHIDSSTAATEKPTDHQNATSNAAARWPGCAMPFDLLRHDLLMTLEPVPWERIISIVDDLFIPLATGKVASDP
jgi:hypothetical protein